MPAGLSRDRDSGRAKQVPLCSMVQFSLDLEGMLMGQHVVGWMGYRSEKGLVLGQRGGEEPPRNRGSV